MKRITYRSFNSARKHAHSLKLKNRDEWIEYCKSNKKPDDIPNYPDVKFKKQGTWKGWGDFLGTGTVAPKDLNFSAKSYKTVQKFALSLGVKTSTEWWAYARSHDLPPGIPKDPSNWFKKQKTWTGWGDFLKTGNVAKKEFRSFTDAKKFAQKLGFRQVQEWIEYCKSGKHPKDIPAAADNAYKKEWKGWPDFLGYDSTGKRKLRTFGDVKKFIQKLKIQNRREWENYCKSDKKPNDIPYSVSNVYKKEWKGWGDFLGTGRISVTAMSKNKRSFNEARKYARSLKCTNIADWTKHSKSGKKPNDIPGDPTIYKKEWKGWGDFLGTGNISVKEKSENWLSIKEAKIEARKLVKKLGIKSNQDWIAAHKAGKIPQNLPRYPGDIYNPKNRKPKPS